MTNILGFLLTLLYIFAVIGIGEGLRRWRGYGSDFTRKVVHIGVGMVMWIIPHLFDNPWWFAGACGAFMVINFLDYKYGFFASMTSSDKSNLGTVYFPFAAGVCAVLFWDRPGLMIAAMMPLTWGDGLAPVVGRKLGWGPYRVMGHTRTLAGSGGFLLAAWLAAWAALTFGAGGPAVDSPFITALILAGVTAVVEGITLWGLDNLAITGVAIVILLQGVS
ncbi:MAG: phosphatidate cytidylyltransferase [Anaerolineales bacterium]